MNRPNPQRRELAEVRKQLRSCRNCGHALALAATELVCFGAPPWTVPGGQTTQWPIVKGHNCCKDHEFPEEMEARGFLVEYSLPFKPAVETPPGKGAIELPR